ncbi:MAG: histidine phosphatase family protein [Vicinamibacterales bacterium]
MSFFLLIRHGDTDAVGHLMTGHAPGVVLNTKGVEQAATLPARLAGVPLAAVYASPLERTMATAQPLANARGLDVQIERGLIEVDFGGWTGRRFADLAADPHWQLYNRVRSITRPPQGESLLDVQQRAVNALLEIHRQHPDDVVAVVSHADVLRAILLYFLGMPVDAVLRLELGPGRISVLEIGAGAPRVWQMNGDSAIGAW